MRFRAGQGIVSETSKISPSEHRNLIQQAEYEYEQLLRKRSLPHLYGFPPYKWTLEFWKSTNRLKFLCAGNQLSKSSTQIRHCIDLATDQSKWDEFFPKRHPQTFLYIYPSLNKAAEEFNEKWVKEFLPRGSMKSDPEYGWSEFYVRNELAGVKFNSGVTVYFKGWKSDLQAYTADAVFIDEELPANLWGEVQARVSRYSGFISMVFTATLNQSFWFDVIEKRGQVGERFPDADKWQISMEYDCQVYADGSPSPFTPSEVQKKKNMCGSQTEIDRRIHGRFVSEKGKKYPSFSREKNLKKRAPIPRGWFFFGGVDIGSSGPTGHPAAISIVAIRPDYQYGRLVRFWKGTEEEHTDTTDILNQFIKMTADLNMTANYYDHQSAEFKIRAERAQVPFEKAEKGQDFGEDLLNVLFKNEMLDLDDIEQVDSLAQEFETLKKDTAKKNAKDDGIDSLRYSVSSIPWDFSSITEKLIGLVEDMVEKKRSTRHTHHPEDYAEENDYEYEMEIAEYNELLGDY